MQLKNKIGFYRKERGLTISKLAQEAKVTRHAIMGYEKNLWQPIDPVQVRIAAALNVDMKDLFFLG